MKHDISLLKSDLDFKWLNAWRLLPCAGLAKKSTSNGNRNCNFFLNNACTFQIILYINIFHAWKRFSLIIQPMVAYLLVNMNIF